MVVCHGRNRWTQGPLAHLLLRCGGLCPSFWRWAQGPAQCWHSLGMEHVRLSSTVAVSETSPSREESSSSCRTPAVFGFGQRSLVIFLAPGWTKGG